jgi:hypothetical protein
MLLLTNEHLESYDRAGAINVRRGKSSAKLSPPFSRGIKACVSNRGYAKKKKNTKLTAIYYNPEKLTAFSTLDKLAAAISRKNKSDVKAWLEYQDVYTMHRPARRRFLRNPYTVTNLMEIWEYDILVMQYLLNTMIRTDTFYL